MPASQPLFVGLIDDAGLFPPTALSMTDALARHRADERDGSDLLTGRFLVPVSRVDEFLDALDDAPIEVGLVVDRPVDELPGVATRLHDDPRTDVTGVELRLGRAADESPAEAAARVHAATSMLPPRVSVFVEVPLDEDLPDTLAALADAGLGAKARCGGTEASAFPSADALATFLAGIVREDLSAKATAGLHHAVRYVDETTGFQHHGVLNLLLALTRAVESRPHAELVEALTTDDTAYLAEHISRINPDLEAQVREQLVAYGSCDTHALARDLDQLGLV